MTTRSRVSRPFNSARPYGLHVNKRDWYTIKAHASGAADIFVYDEIGFWGVSAHGFVQDLQALDTQAINLRINSPGGDVFDGIAIYNALRNHPASVSVTVDGLAASIASVIAMAGDTITMGRGAQMMIHDALAMCVGNAADMRQTAALLDKCSDNIAGFYADKAGGDVADWRATMAAETWYTADEAVAAGLATSVAALAPAPEDLPANKWDLGVFTYAGREQAPAPLARRQVAPVVRDTGPAISPDVPVAAPPVPGPMVVPPGTGVQPTFNLAEMFRDALGKGNR